MQSEILFSNKLRWPIIFFIGIVLAGFYYHLGHVLDKKELSYFEALQNPSQYQGAEIVLMFAPVVGITEGGFHVESQDLLISIVGNLDKVAIGQTVSLKGILQPDLSLTLTAGLIHPYRPVKYVVSLAVLIVLGILLLREVWITRREFYG